MRARSENRRALSRRYIIWSRGGGVQIVAMSWPAPHWADQMARRARRALAEPGASSDDDSGDDDDDDDGYDRCATAVPAIGPVRTYSSEEEESDDGVGSADMEAGLLVVPVPRYPPTDEAAVTTAQAVLPPYTPTDVFHSSRGGDDDAGGGRAAASLAIGAQRREWANSGRAAAARPAATTDVLRWASDDDDDDDDDDSAQYYDPDEEYAANERALSTSDATALGLSVAAGSGGSTGGGAGATVQVDHVYLAFLTLVGNDGTDGDALRPEDSFWQWMNQFVRGFTNYIHCELVFMVRAGDGAYRRVTSSIHRSHELRMTTKEYKAKKLRHWRFFHYACSAEQRAAMYAYERDAQLTPFNRVGFMWNFIVPADVLCVDYDGERVFCSEQISRNLRVTAGVPVGQHDALVPYATHPSALLEYMHAKYAGQFRECAEPTAERPAPQYIARPPPI